MQHLCGYAGVRVRRLVDRASACVPEHAHDWPVLSLFVLGGYRNRTDLGEVAIAGPSAVLYGAGAAHANLVGPQGFEQIEIEFDPRWLNLSQLDRSPVRRWIGGPMTRRITALSQLCQAQPAEELLRDAVKSLLATEAAEPPASPTWIAQAEDLARADLSLTVAELSQAVGRHPAWVGSVYAQCRGEELRTARARFRVEHAARLLREADDPQAQVALDSGFCDQSHMIRVFRRLLGRTPSQVRSDRQSLREVA